MATTNSVPDAHSTETSARAGMLVFVAPMGAESLANLIATLSALFPGEGLLIATPNDTSGTTYPGLRVISTQATNAVWPLTAADFVHVMNAAKENGSRGVLMLGPGADSLSTAALRELANAVSDSTFDLAVPHYSLPPSAGLVNSAILYPLSRALFGSRARFPLSIDLAFSFRMAERLAGTAQRFVNSAQSDAIIWPV